MNLFAYSNLVEKNPYLIENTNKIYTNLRKQKIARDILERYTGSTLKQFQKQIILTNFSYYMDRFAVITGGKVTRGSAMSAVHSAKDGVSIINFSIGSPTAALIIECLAVL